MTPRPPLVHPDPGWWKRCKPVKADRSKFATDDICYYCGHARHLHAGHGCRAASTSLIGNPGPCDCTNRADGLIFRDARTLHSG